MSRAHDHPATAAGATASSGETTYAAAGVDVEAGDRAVELMKAAVAGTHSERVVGGVGGFAGLFDVSELKDYRRPLLATSTDGVGTKVAIAQAMDVHDTIGFDLVGMVVDDIVVCGARPLVMTDYIACGHVVPERIAAIVRGIAEACRAAGVALVGGETAEHPGLLRPDEYDVAGAATGVVEADRLLGPERVRAGDVVLALSSSGLHSNGYSLVRRIIADAGWGLERVVPEFGRTLGEELLEPTRVYSADLLDVVDDARFAGGIHAISHVTGGGLAANVARVLPRGLLARLDRGSWEVPPVFQVLGDLGRVPQADRDRRWNLGVGMVVVVSAEIAGVVQETLAAGGQPTWQLGLVDGDDRSLASDSGYVQGSKGVDGGAVLIE